MGEAGSTSLSLVVPVFNEEERLGRNGPELADFVVANGAGSELVIVDDGSTDRTWQVAERLRSQYPDAGVRLVRCPHRGKGASIRAGLQSATTALAGFCDVDLATPLDQFARLCGAAASGAVLVIGSRGVRSAQLVQRESGLRESLGRSYNRLLRLTLTPGIYDTQCGAKVATTSVWREILPYCRESGFAWDVEAVALARRRGIAVWEMGVRWSHDSRTRVRPLQDGMAMVWAVPRMWRRLQSVPAAFGTKASGVVEHDGLVRPLPGDS